MTSRAGRSLFLQLVRNYSNSAGKDVKHYKLVVAGGGTGGCSVAARACRALGAGNVAVIEPAEVSLLSFTVSIIIIHVVVLIHVRRVVMKLTALMILMKVANLCHQLYKKNLII